MKKLLMAVILCLGLLFNGTPVQAASGNGYISGTITVNGATYNFTVSFASVSNYGLQTKCSTQANIQRQHNAISAKYLTKTHGYVYGYSAQNSVTRSGVSTSNTAYCPYGASDVEKLMSGTGKVVMYANPAKTVDVRVSF